MFPVAEIRPLVNKLPVVVLPVDESAVVTNPVVVKVATFAVPATLTVTLLLAATTTLLVPLTICVGVPPPPASKLLPIPDDAFAKSIYAPRLVPPFSKNRSRSLCTSITILPTNVVPVTAGARLIWPPSPPDAVVTKSSPTNPLPVVIKLPAVTLPLALIVFAIPGTLVQLLVALEYWYVIPFTTDCCPFVGDTGNAIVYPYAPLNMQPLNQVIVGPDVVSLFAALPC